VSNYNLGPRNIPRHSALSDDTFDHIRELILHYEITPGEHISIDGLSRAIGVSQTPIREALARLESEGLVIKEALKGYAATPLITKKEFDDLFQFRLLIEPWGAAQAAENINEAGRDALQRELILADEATMQEDSFVAITEHDARFHNLIARLSEKSQNNQRNKNSVDENAVTDLFRHYYSADTGHLSIAEHKEVTAAIIAKDPERASATLHAHIAGSREFLIKTMDVLGRP
jgi:DNA-binding GntR family transcriptional regulator